MTRDDVIRMAREAHGPLTGQWFDMDVEALERFAALVAAAEREECAKVAEWGEHMNESTYWRQQYEKLMATFAESVRVALDAQNPRYLANTDSYNLGKLHGAQEEREACAQICDAEASIEGIAQRCAANIRKRGEV